jgi:hypothetical protein
MNISVYWNPRDISVYWDPMSVLVFGHFSLLERLSAVEPNEHLNSLKLYAQFIGIL